MDITPEPPQPRRRLAPWVAVAVVVLALAGVATAVAVWPSHGGAGGAPGCGSGTKRKYVDYLCTTGSGGLFATGDLARVPQDDVGFGAVIRDDAHPDRITIMVDGADGEQCSVYDPRPEVVADSSSSIRIRVPAEELMPRPTGTGGYYSYGCIEPPQVPIPVQLGEPLGSRAVLGAVAMGGGDGPHPMLDGAVPEPAYLPPGYVGDGVQGLDPQHDRLTARRTYRHADARLTVSAGAADQLETRQPPGAPDPGARRVDVAGHHARLGDGPGGRCVTWTIRTGVAISVCDPGGIDRTLPDAELLKVARSLRR